MTNWLEYKNLNDVLGRPPRSPHQLNAPFESDCEIFKVAGGYQGCSTDMVSEEILLGLYQRPETWAWIAVMTSVSDLAASALKPQGLTMACQWAVGTEEKTQKIFF